MDSSSPFRIVTNLDTMLKGKVGVRIFGGSQIRVISSYQRDLALLIGDRE